MLANPTYKRCTQRVSAKLYSANFSKTLEERINEHRI